MEQEHNGYFKVGDYIEISGKPIGIVIYADEKEFHINKILSTHDSLIPDINVYSNDASDYENKYWIHRGEAPIEYTRIEPQRLY